jgi:hypothetical protein
MKSAILISGAIIVALALVGDALVVSAFAQVTNMPGSNGSARPMATMPQAQLDGIYARCQALLPEGQRDGGARPAIYPLGSEHCYAISAEMTLRRHPEQIKANDDSEAARKADAEAVKHIMEQ